MTKPKASRKKISHANKEIQKYELVSIDAMFPGAVRLLNKGFLKEEDIEINNLTSAAQSFGFGSLWSVPEEDGSSSFMSLISNNSNSIKFDSEILEYRIVFTHSDNFDVAGDDTTERFVVDVAYPPDYPPSPPLVKIYTNFHLSKQQQSVFVSMCRDTILDSHPLFQERIIPLCDIIVERIKLCRDSQHDAWSELSSKRMREISAPSLIKERVTTDADIPTVSITSDLMAAQSRFHADVLKELGLGTESKSFPPAPLQTESDLESDLSNDTQKQPPDEDFGSPLLENSRRNPIDFYYQLNLVDREGTPENRSLDVQTLKSSKSIKRRKQRRETISLLTGEANSASPISVPGSLPSGHKKGLSRIDSDFHNFKLILLNEDHGIPSLKIQGPVSKHFQKPQQGILSFTAINRIDKFRYIICVVRVEFITSALREFHPSLSHDFNSLALQIKSAVQSFSHTDNIHLGRINSVWLDFIPTDFLNGFLSISQAPCPGVKESCVCVQSECLDNLIKVTSYTEIQEYVEKDPLLPVRVAQQILETMTFLHRHKFAFLQDFENLRMTVDDLGYTLKLPTPNIAATTYIALTHSGSTITDERAARATARLLGLSAASRDLLEEHSKDCGVHCQTPTNACPLMLAIDTRMFCNFFAKFIKMISTTNELSAEITPFTTQIEKLLKTRLKDFTSSLDLLQMANITKPMLDRETLKDFLYQTANPMSPDGMLAVDRLFKRQHFWIQPDIFLFNSKEIVLSQIWHDPLEDHLLYYNKIRSEILEADASLILDDTVLKHSAKDFLEASQTIRFGSFTESFRFPSIIYKDVITSQILGSFIESISGLQVDLPSVLGSHLSMSQKEYAFALKSLMGDKCTRLRGLKLLETVDFLGFVPEDRTSTYLTKTNFLITLPKSLVSSLMSSRSHVIDQVLEQPQVCIQNVYRPGEHYGHPLSALRLLVYTNFVSDDQFGLEFSSWAELFVSLGVLFQPFLNRFGSWRLIVSFPNLLLNIVQVLEEGSESRQMAVMNSLVFGTKLGEEYKDVRNSQLYETLRRVADLGPQPIEACLEIFHQIQRSLETPASQQTISACFSSVSCLIDFFSDVDFCGLEVAMDLFQYPAWPNSPMSSGLFFILQHVTESVILGCGAVNQQERFWWSEICIETFARFMNSVETDLWKQGSPEETYLISHLASPRVLILMQRSNCELSLSLLSRLQLVGIQADCIVVPTLNMSTMRNEIPRTSLGVLFLIMVNHRDASRVQYKVDSLMEVAASPCVVKLPIWRTETLPSENAVFSYILGHISKTKSNVRSAVLRECAKSALK